MLEQMKEEGVEPTFLSYSTAVQACLAASKTREAQSLMVQMVRAGHAPADELKALIAEACGST